MPGARWAATAATTRLPARKQVGQQEGRCSCLAHRPADQDAADGAAHQGAERLGRDRRRGRAFLAEAGGRGGRDEIDRRIEESDTDATDHPAHRADDPGAARRAHDALCRRPSPADKMFGQHDQRGSDESGQDPHRRGERDDRAACGIVQMSHRGADAEDREQPAGEARDEPAAGEDPRSRRRRRHDATSDDECAADQQRRGRTEHAASSVAARPVRRVSAGAVTPMPSAPGFADRRGR